MALQIDSASFKEEVLESDKLVLVDFWTHGCRPCTMIAPIIDKLSNEQTDVKICKVNANESVDLSRTYGVSAVPTLVFFKNGQAVKKIVGLCSENILKEHFESLKE